MARIKQYISSLSSGIDSASKAADIFFFSLPTSQHSLTWMLMRRGWPQKWALPSSGPTCYVWGMLLWNCASGLIGALSLWPDGDTYLTCLFSVVSTNMWCSLIQHWRKYISVKNLIAFFFFLNEWMYVLWCQNAYKWAKWVRNNKPVKLIVARGKDSELITANLWGIYRPLSPHC